MPYVIAEPCIDIMDRSCVDECPVDCIYVGGRMAYVNPDECIDCSACEPVCPVEAITPLDDVSDADRAFIGWSAGCCPLAAPLGGHDPNPWRNGGEDVLDAVKPSVCETLDSEKRRVVRLRSTNSRCCPLVSDAPCAAQRHLCGPAGRSDSRGNLPALSDGPGHQDPERRTAPAPRGKYRVGPRSCRVGQSVDTGALLQLGR